MNSPKWITPDKINYLENLYLTQANRCRLGHLNCAIIEHYARTASKIINVVTKVTDKQYRDSNDKPILDITGKPVTYKHYTIKRMKLDYDVVLTTIDDDGIIRKLTDFDINQNKVVKNWSDASREDTLAQLDFEAKLRHWNYDSRNNPLRGTFSGIAQDIYFDSQPVFKLIQLLFNPLDKAVYAHIKITASDNIYFVNVNELFTGISKNAKHKAIRHNRLSSQFQIAIDTLIAKIITELKYR